MLVPLPVQTNYNRYLTVAQNGMPATTSGWDIDTRLCEDISVGLTGIGFGLAVCQGGASDRAAILGAPSGRKFIGITAADITLPNVLPGTTDVYSNGDNMAVLVRGDIWVIAADAVTAGAAVYFNPVTGVLGSSSSSETVKCDNAMWMTSATPGSLPYGNQVVPPNFAVCRLGTATGNSE